MIFPVQTSCEFTDFCVKHKEAVEAHEKLMAENQARAEQAARNAVFLEMVKAGDTIHMKAEKADEFWEVSPRNGSVLVVHNVSDHPSGPVTALALKLIEDGRNPTSVLEITVHGKPCRLTSGASAVTMVQRLLCGTKRSFAAFAQRSAFKKQSYHFGLDHGGDTKNKELQETLAPWTCIITLNILLSRMP